MFISFARVLPTQSSIPQYVYVLGNICRVKLFALLLQVVACCSDMTFTCYYVPGWCWHKQQTDNTRRTDKRHTCGHTDIVFTAAAAVDSCCATSERPFVEHLPTCTCMWNQGGWKLESIYFMEMLGFKNWKFEGNHSVDHDDLGLLSCVVGSGDQCL